MATGTTITNVANITFDRGAAIATDQVNDEDASAGISLAKQAKVTIDATPPTSSVASLPAYTNTTSFTVSWPGSDGAGSGIATYNVFVSEDGGPITVFQSNTTATSATFTGQFGHTYSFFSVATDNVGLVQATPANTQASTLLAGPPTSTVGPLPAITTTTPFLVSWTGTPGPGATNIAMYEVYSSEDRGAFTPLLTNTTLTSTTFNGVFGHTYSFYSVATDNLGDVQPAPSTGQATTKLVGLPTSTVKFLAATTTTTTFPVSWTGTPGPGATNIAIYEVFVAEDSGSFTPFVNNTTATSANFTGQFGHTYRFYSVATDNFGDVQPTPASAQATTYLAGLPTSSVAALPAMTSTPSFTVSWTGTPGPGASSIASYAVYDSDNGGPFTAFLTNTTLTSTTFNGVSGHTYGFYSVATDNLGDTQTTPTAPQATTTVASAPMSTVSALPAVTTTTTFTLSWSGTPGPGATSIASYTIYDSDNGGAFTAFLSNTTLTSTPFNGQIGHSYGFYSVATDNLGSVQPTPSGAQATTTIDSPPTSTVAPLPAKITTASFTRELERHAGAGGHQHQLVRSVRLERRRDVHSISDRHQLDVGELHWNPWTYLRILQCGDE